MFARLLHEAVQHYTGALARYVHHNPHLCRLTGDSTEHGETLGVARLLVVLLLTSSSSILSFSCHLYSPSPLYLTRAPLLCHLPLLLSPDVRKV